MDIVFQTIGVAILLLFPLWKIHEKAGQPPALALLVLIPAFGPLISALVLAFVPWKEL